MPLDYIEFAKKVKSKYPEYNDVDDLTLAKKMIEKYPEYKNEVSFEPLKKKEVSQSTRKDGAISSAISKTAQKQPSVSSGEAYNWNGKTYIYRNNAWEETALFEGNKLVPQSQKSAFKKVTDRNKIKQLNYQFKKDVSLDPIDKIYSNYDEEKKDNEYRVKDGNWERKLPGSSSWNVITNEGSVSALNRRYNQSVKYTPELKLKKTEPKLEFADVNTSLVAKTEEDAVSTLSKKYGKYGFTFEQTGRGTDYVTVYNKDKSKEITVGFDEKNPEEALKLKNFLEQNASKQKSATYDNIQSRKESEKDYYKYISSDEYKNDFKSLSYDEMEKEIDNRLGFISRTGEPEKRKERIDALYNSNAYKIFKEKKKEEFGARDQRIDLLYTELQSAKASGNKNAIKDINSKITAYLNNDVIQDQVKNYSMQLNDLDNAAKKLASDQKKYLQSVEDFNKLSQSGQMSQEEFDQTKKMLDDQAEALSTRADFLMSSGKSIQTNQKKLNVVAGKYVSEKEKAGGFIGGTINSFLGGVGKLIEDFNPKKYIIELDSYKDYKYNRLSPEEKKLYKDKGYSEDQIKNKLTNDKLKEIKKEIKGALIEGIGSDLTTEEYMKSKDRGFFEKAIYGVSESVPAMLMGFGGSNAAFIGLSQQSYSSIEDEMLNDSDFETTSAEERALVAVPYATLMGVLENYGLKNVVKGESFAGGIVKNILASSIKKMPKGASREVLQSIMDKEVKNLIAKGSLKIINGAIAEFETGATQSLVLDIGLKSLYNKFAQSGMTKEEIKNLSGGEMFTTPDSVGEIASTVLEDGLAEAVGGATIGTFTTVASGLMNGNISLYNEEDLEYLKEISQDSNFKKIIVANLKTEMLKGNLTKSEAQERLDAMNELTSVMESIPDGLTKEDQIDAVNMLSEKNRLTREIQGKDPALVTAQTERINEINEELKTISKNAVQVETTGEVPVQPEAAVGGEMAQGESQAESQDFTEEGQAAAQEEVNIFEFNGKKYEVTNESTTDLETGNLVPIDLATQIREEGTLVETKPIEETVVVEPITKQEQKQNLVTQENVEELRAQQTTPVAQKIFTAAKLAMKALPGVKVYVHNTTTEFDQGIGQKSAEGSKGAYVDGEIHINLENGADVVTMLHESLHHGLVIKGVQSGAMLDLAKGLKSVVSDKGLRQRLDDFVSGYDASEQSEEYVAELGAIMAEAQQELTTTKFQQFKNLINKISQKLGLPVVFSASANAKNAVDFMNSLTKAISTGQEIKPTSPYSVGEAVSVKPNAPMKIKYERKTEYNVDFVTKIPTKSLEDVVNKYDGRVFMIQSDATGVGYDSNGDPIYGGIGYIAIKENVDGKIGFASVDMNTAKITISKMIKRYGPNEKIAVLVMVQNPSSTVGNYYGGKYFGRALIELQKQSKTNYKAIANSFVDFIESKQSVIDALNKNKTKQNLIELINNPGKFNEVGFAEEFVKDTTFDVRREILKTLLPEKADITTNKSTPYIKQSLKDLGFNRMAFLNEYGDNTLFTEDMYASDEGGLLAAGFEMTLPTTEGIDQFTSGIENRGIKHHLFNGKLPYTDESFLLDGLYPVNENFSEFAKSQMVFNEENLNKDQLKKIVQEKFSTDKSYDDKYTRVNSNNFVKIQDRTYTHLTSPNKIKFKAELQETNPEYFKEQLPNVSTDIARGMGFTAEKGAKQEALVEKAKTKGFSKIKFQKANLTTDKDAKPGYEAALNALNETEQQREQWRKNNKVNQKQKRNPLVEQAVKDYFNEEITQEEYLETVAKNQPIKPFKQVPALPTLEEITNALDSNKVATGIIGLTKNLEDGEKVASRLDIPAYEDFDTWVVSVHDGNKEGKSIAYGQTAVLKNVDFKTFPGPAIRIAMGTQSKSTIARMFGNWVNEDPESVHTRAKESMNDPAWTQVGMNPFRHSWFYDKTDGMPLASADEVVQVGALVLAKNAVKVLPSDPMFETKSGKGGKIKFQKAEKKGPYIKIDGKDFTDVFVNNGIPFEYLSDIKNQNIPDWLGGKNKKITELRDSLIRSIDNALASLEDDLEKQSKKIRNSDSNLAFRSSLINKKQERISELKELKSSIEENLLSELDIEIGLKESKPKFQKANTQQEAIQKAKEKYILLVDQRGDPHKQGVDAALNDLRKSDWYKNTDDTQRENAERELKEFFGEKLKKAPSAAKVLGKPKAKKVAIKDEYKAMITQIKLEAKAAREARADVNAKRKMLAAAISGMVKTGKIKASQAAVLVKRVSNLNLDNPVMVERFTNYAERVFQRADYQQRLDDAFALRKSIRKLLKTDNQAEVVGMAKAFTKIDPSLVDDIDAYMEMADKVKNAVKPSRVKGIDVVMKEAANIADISEYTNQEIARQEDIQMQELLAIHDYLEDISKDMSLKEIQDIINLLKEKPNEIVDKEAKVKEFLKNRFDFMAGVIETMFKTGVDPMTSEEITFDEKQKDLMKRVLKIDLDEMSTREAIKIVEGVDNFINNQITSGLESAVSSYEGNTNVKSLVARGKVARPLRLFGTKLGGRFYSEQLFSLPMLMEKMFGGVTNSIDIMRKSGLLNVINGVNKAVRQHNDIIDDFSKQDFAKGKDFMDAENIYEVGMLAELKRNLIGTKAEMQAEFKRRVDMLKDSIDLLIEEGNNEEKKMGELYKKVYDKLNIDSMDMDVINANASKNNLEAVNWWINEWSKHRSELFDVSLSVYNTMLTADLNYTPDTLKTLSDKNEGLDESIVNQNGAFSGSLNNIDKNKSGVLMETVRKRPSNRYISLDFYNNNSKALKAALTDINTASAIRQVDGFLSSKAFKKLVPEAKDRALLERRISTYIKRAKGKNLVPRDTIQYLNKFVNFVTALGVGKALAGLNQTVMQTAPVMLNTFANAGRFDFADADFNNWLNESGMPISNRGLESQSTIDSIDKKLDAKGQTTEQILKGVTKVNQWWLRQLLVKPDVWVARSSFKSYYLQNLKRRGMSTDIDWKNHEIDKEAAEYAQIMIDRQQNISDPMLAGEFLASEDPMRQIARKIFIPFASFILNQKARMYNDMITITSKTASSQDRVIAMRSLAGLGVELLAYQMIGFGIRRLYDNIARWLLGDEDDEETKRKKLINATKYPIKSIVNDIISPLPILDDFTTMGFNQALAQYPWMDDKEIKDAVKERNRILELKGDDPMDAEAEAEYIDKIKNEAMYQVYRDDNERKYGMIGIAGDTYKEVAEISKLYATGEFTDEYKGMEIKKKLLDSDRKDVGMAILPMVLYSTGLLTKDVGTIGRSYVNRIKKKAVTEKQYERYDAVQKDLGRNLKSWEVELIKNKKESETAIDEINFIERNGGLTERQGREYIKVMKAIGEPGIRDIIDIKDGKTADQILK
jgi:cytochrome c1